MKLIGKRPTQKHAERARMLRHHGDRGRYDHVLVGGNFRLEALQAAVLLVKLKHLDDWTAKRQANAALYRKLFAEAGLVGPRNAPTVDDVGRGPLAPPVLADEPRHAAERGGPRATRPTPRGGAPGDRRCGQVTLPVERPGRHTYNQFVIEVAGRDELCAFLSERRIGHSIYYPRPLHLQPCFSDLGYKPGDFPAAERACARVLALPIYPELPEPDAERVVEAIAGFFRGR
jgi:dTDP-4-amino-4,6-dideoxygalactose transaminase